MSHLTDENLEEIRTLIREEILNNLSINVEAKESYDYGTTSISVNVSVTYGEKVVATSGSTILTKFSE